MIAERIRASVESDPSVFGTVNIAITVSIGGVPWQSGSDLTLDHMLALADDALYSAKNGGRNRVEWASPPDGSGRGAPLGAA